jgi:hypothetical protein
MVPFNLELELAGKALIVSVEQLDQLADDEGYIRYDITEDLRQAVVYVNVEDQLLPLETAQDAAYFEAVHYPEHLPAFSLEDDFTTAEVNTIANAIRQYNRKLRFMFNKFMNRSLFPDL